MGKNEYTRINPKSNNQQLKAFQHDWQPPSRRRRQARIQPKARQREVDFGEGPDQVKGTADSLAGQAQPEDQKSYTQQATDAISNAGQQVSDTLGLSGGSE